MSKENALKSIILKCGFVRMYDGYRLRLPNGSYIHIDQYQFVDEWPKHAKRQALEEYLKYLSDMATKELGYTYQFTSNGVVTS